jgi:hypothetical protein
MIRNDYYFGFLGFYLPYILVFMTDQETLKYYSTYDPPPADFNPLQAEDRLLRVHGFPRRPDAVKEPRLRELWDQAFSTKPSIVKAELAVNHELTKWKRT